MRLRYKNGVYPGRVWAPNYTDVDWIYTSMEMYVEPLTGQCISVYCIAL